MQTDHVALIEIDADAGLIPTAVRLEDQLCFALYAATNTITRVYRPLLEPLGITYPQYLVLLVIWEHETLAVGEIADRLNLPAHAISPLIDRMEQNGLVQRTADVLDGRRVLVSATAKGVELEVDAAAAWDQVRCRTLMERPELLRLRKELLDLVDRMQPT